MENRINCIEKFVSQNESAKIKAAFIPSKQTEKALNKYIRTKDNACWLIIFCGLVSLTNGMEMIIRDYTVAFGICCMLLAVLIFLYPVWMDLASRPSEYEHSYEFYGDYLAEVTYCSVRTFAYTDISSTRETDDYSFISAHGKVLGIPKSAFAGDDIKALHDFFTEKLGQRLYLKFKNKD